MRNKFDWIELQYKIIMIPTRIKCFFMSHDEDMFPNSHKRVVAHALALNEEE